MVRVLFHQQFSAEHALLHVRGHADYSQKGADIVCSAVSILMYTYAEALEKVAGCTIKVEDKKDFSIYIQEQRNPAELKCVTETILIGLSSLAEQYPEHVQLTIS